MSRNELSALQNTKLVEEHDASYKSDCQFRIWHTLAALLTTCGSGMSINGSTGADASATPAPAPTLVGTFIDAPVVGLGYSTNSGSGG